MLIPSPCRRWQYRVMRFWCWCAVVLAACTKPNPAVCCLDEADCASIGVSDPERTCADGLACVDNACVVPSCSTDGCSAEAPVCDITLDVCTGCTGPADCDQFDTKVCDVDSGRCVECVTASECTGIAPVCDEGACRGCVLDSECDSGACGDNGACVAESEIVFMDSQGGDTGACTRAAPCQTIEYAIGQASIARSHIVLALGTYSDGDVDITPANTTAPRLTFHGSGATLTGASEDTIGVTVPATFRNVIISNTGGGRALSTASAQIVLDHVQISGPTGLTIDGSVTAHDVTIEATSGDAISLFTGSLDLDRATLRSPSHVIDVGNNTTMLIKNTVIFGSSDVAIDAIGASGALEFVTITKVGVSSTVNAAGLLCGPNLAVRSSIVWTPGALKPPISGACTLTDVLAGPTAVAGAGNQDPLFADPNANDFHLGPGSPARDAVNAGPPFDFEGEARPQGERFDIGADESL